MPEPAPLANVKKRSEREPVSNKTLLLFGGVIAVLSVCGWFLVQWMAGSARLQDCMASGRKNCAEMDPALGR